MAFETFASRVDIESSKIFSSFCTFDQYDPSVSSDTDGEVDFRRTAVFLKYLLASSLTAS